MSKFTILHYLPLCNMKHFVRTRLHKVPDYIRYILLIDNSFRKYLVDDDDDDVISLSKIDDLLEVNSRNNKIIIFMSDINNNNLVREIIKYFKVSALILTTSPSFPIKFNEYSLKKYYIPHVLP